MTPAPAGIRLGVLPPLALYVHIPWCVKKCPYCDFNSHQVRGDVPERAYVEALVSDLELALPDVWGRRVTSIFFGGGTPSLFSAAAIETLISAFRAHLSFYHLTLEPNTLFYRHQPALPDEDAAAAMQDAIGAALAARGYAHYETSAWAKPGRECRHNLNYWRFGDYLGIGAGAHGKLSFPDRVARTARWKQPREYLQRVAEGRPVQEIREVGRDDLVFEFMMNALRLTDGFPVASFVERTGLQIAVAERQLREAETRGLIARDHERIRPTDLGQRV